MKILLIVITLVSFLSCPKIEVDYGGSAYYYIINDSEQKLKISYVLNSELGFKEGFSNIDPNDTMEIYNDFIIGVNPKPENTFKSLMIQDLNNNIILEQNPVNNDMWSSDKFFNSDFGRTNYYLHVE